MSTRFTVLFFVLALGLSAKPKFKIIDKPISFSKWRITETKKYIKHHYGEDVKDITMKPVMVVVHWTAIYSLRSSWRYMNKEKMETGRKKLLKAGLNNIAVHFLVGQRGEIYRLMPENHIGRHCIGLNRKSIGIENVGGPKAPLTRAQLEANAWLIRYLAKKHKIKYVIGHQEYRNFENTPLFEELDPRYRTHKIDPGKSFMRRLRHKLRDLKLKARYSAE